MNTAKETRNIKKLKDLTIRDNFLFAAVMQRGNNCKHFLEMLLGIEIDRIDILYEKSIIYNPEYKGIRMDVYAQDEMSTCYNIEMQVLRDDLSRRSRYYHSQMDMELLDSGDDYENLPGSYVIFICDYDPFNRGRYCYCFENLCLEDTGLRLEDGSRSIFLSTKGKNFEEVPRELVCFLDFIRENEAGETRDYQDEYVRQLQKSIREVKRSREMRSRYMLLELMLRDEYRKGKAEGRAESKAESILDLLSVKGSVPKELYQTIMEEYDLKVLRSMFNAAIMAESVEEFMKSISTIKSEEGKS